jgi:serine/threonine protein phosphatase PrpC
MNYVFNKTERGYHHIKNHVVCEDFSSSYTDHERMIISCADGHGGAKYIRSQYGSKFAVQTVNSCFSKIRYKDLIGNIDKVSEKIKLNILCEWNAKVERDISNRPFRKFEFDGLSDEDSFDILTNRIKAYGTTLVGALVIKDKVVIVGIGDTEVIGVKNGEIVKLFDDKDDPAGNITYSMCQEDAYKYLKVKIINKNELDMILICTDGLSGPYQSYTNFKESFILPCIKKILESQSVTYIDEFVTELATSKGNGDDVSLAFILFDNTKKKYY